MQVYQTAVQENTRLKARIRVIEAVLPQRQQTPGPASSADAALALVAGTPDTSAGQGDGSDPATSMPFATAAPGQVAGGSPAMHPLPPSLRTQPAGAGARSASPAPRPQRSRRSEAVSGRSVERSCSPGSEACSRSTAENDGSQRQGSVSQGTPAQDKSDLWMAAWVK